MKKLIVVLALALLILPGIVQAQTKGCGWDGDPALRYGWNYMDGLPYHQPGADQADIYAGGSITRELGCYNAAATWLPAGCKAAAGDTLCAHVTDKLGWTISGSPALDAAVILPGPGYIWYQYVTITAPCAVTICQYDTVIVQVAYWNTFLGHCDPACGDCKDPNIRPTDGLQYYSKDTLVVHVIESPPALGVFQDTLTLVDRGQTQAYIPFSVCNQDNCAPLTTYGYSIKSKGHVGPALNVTSTVQVSGGDCKDVYGIIDAGAASACQFDTLKIIVWTTVGTPTKYDTCVQRIHVVEPSPVPLFTVPVVTILVLALILAAAVFMRRRAVSRA